MTHARPFALAATLALCLAGTAMAQDATRDTTGATGAPASMTEPEVRAALEAQGYTRVNDVEFDDGMWKADARSADGQRVELRMDPATGKVYPEDAVASLSEADVRAKLSAAGYTNVHDVDFDDGVWTAEADDSNGREVELTLDPDTGRIVGKDR